MACKHYGIKPEPIIKLPKVTFMDSGYKEWRSDIKMWEEKIIFLKYFTIWRYSLRIGADLLIKKKWFIRYKKKYAKIIHCEIFPLSKTDEEKLKIWFKERYRK